MAATCAALLAAYPEEWRGAVRHRFLSECGDGVIAPERFSRWVQQDYLFVLAFVRFDASAIAKAPPQHLDVLLAGMAALREELNWFKELAAKLGVPLDPSAAPHPVCRRYIALLQGVAAEQPYAAHVTALWAIERCYNQAWRDHASAVDPFAQCAARWGGQGFSAWVSQLEDCADEALAAAPPAERQAAEALFLKICDLEGDFWEMAYSGLPETCLATGGAGSDVE